MSQPRSTVRNVADASGVSASTVSRVLSGKAETYRISRPTVAKVRAAAERLNFRPGRAARRLRPKKSGLIGLVVPDVANPFFAGIASEPTRSLARDGYSVVLADSGGRTDAERHLIEQFVDREVEAMAVCAVGVDAGHLASLDRAGVPVVVIDRVFPGTKLTSVASDNRTAAAVTQLLLDRGHRAIGVLTGPAGTHPNEERLAGVREAFAEAGDEVPEARVRGDDFTEESGHRAAACLLNADPEITGLIAFSVPNAVGALRAAAESSRRVPALRSSRSTTQRERPTCCSVSAGEPSP